MTNSILRFAWKAVEGEIIIETRKIHAKHFDSSHKYPDKWLWCRHTYMYMTQSGKTK